MRPTRRARGSGTGALLILLAAAPILAVGQEPPSHFPVCSSDTTARAFLSRVRYLLSAADTAGRARLERLSLTPTPPDGVTLVIEEPICLAAATAYAANAHRANGLHPPFPVVVV